MPRGLHDYSVRVCLPAGLKVASPLSTDRLIPGLARISEGFKHCGDPVRGVGCIGKSVQPGCNFLAMLYNPCVLS